MANNPYVNKVIYGNTTVMDISDTTATEGDVVSGKTFYKASGERSTGSAVIPDISVSGKTLATPTSGTNPISTTSGSFKCDTHNCIMGGYAKGASGSSPLIYLDGDVILGSNNGQEVRLGYPDANNRPTTYGFFIPKGKTVTTRSSGTYALYFYEVD